MRSTIAKPTDREEWLDARRPYVGASEVAALIGEHPFLSTAELAVSKLSGTNQDETGAMRRGRFLEDAVATWWAADRGVEVTEPTDLYVYGDALCSTLDRVVVGSGEIVEIKTTHGYCSEPEPYWLHQVQAQLLCTGAERANLVVLDSSLELRTFTIDADPAHGQRLYAAAAEFLEIIRRGEMPEVPMTYRTATLLHPEPSSSRVELDDQAASWCRQLDQLQARIGLLREDEDVLKGMIGHRLGDAAEGVRDGRSIVTWRTVTRRIIDAKALRAEHPDLAKVYERPSISRVMHLVRRRS